MRDSVRVSVSKGRIPTVIIEEVEGSEHPGGRYLQEEELINWLLNCSLINEDPAVRHAFYLAAQALRGEEKYDD